jgi:hypothetical protein
MQPSAAILSILTSAQRAVLAENSSYHWWLLKTEETSVIALKFHALVTTTSRGKIIILEDNSLLGPSAL